MNQQQLSQEEIQGMISRHGKSYTARILMGHGYDNRSITTLTSIDKAALSRLRSKDGAAPAIVRVRKPKTETEAVNNPTNPPSLLFQQNIQINQPSKEEPVDEKSITGIAVVCLLMLTVPILIGVAYANIYYKLISTITPNHFSALISTIALEISPFVIFLSNNAIGRIMKGGNDLQNVFRMILWILCLVDVFGISYSLIQSGAGVVIGVAYSVILTILHTGIISLTNEVLSKWTQGK